MGQPELVREGEGGREGKRKGGREDGMLTVLLW